VLLAADEVVAVERAVSLVADVGSAVVVGGV